MILVIVVNMLGDINVLIYRISYLYICSFIIVCTYSITNSIVHFIADSFVKLHIGLMKVSFESV